MNLNIPKSMSLKKQSSQLKINGDEFEMILSIMKDEDIGISGGSIDETQELQALKDKAVHSEQVKGDQEDALLDKARSRVIDGTKNYKYSIHTVKTGEDLRSIALASYGDANAWVIIAAANNITDPLSEKQIYPGRQLLII
jgi:nucleoid-associated protein YgaU